MLRARSLVEQGADTIAFASCISKKPVWLLKDKKVYRKIQEELARFQADTLIDQRLGDLSGGELQ